MLGNASRGNGTEDRKARHELRQATDMSTLALVTYIKPRTLITYTSGMSGGGWGYIYTRDEHMHDISTAGNEGKSKTSWISLAEPNNKSPRSEFGLGLGFKIIGISSRYY